MSVPKASCLLRSFCHLSRCLRRSIGSVVRFSIEYSSNYGESHSLAAIRDALLPKLISGELRVKDAEQFLAEARA